MIKELNSVEEYRDFYHGLCTDPSFSQPNTKEDKVDERFKKALEKDDRRVVAIRSCHWRQFYNVQERYSLQVFARIRASIGHGNI